MIRPLRVGRNFWNIIDMVDVVWVLNTRKGSMDKVPGTYEKLYDIIKENLKQAGMEITFGKESFLYSTKRDLTCADVFDFLDYDKGLILEVSYIAFFARIPEVFT